MQCKIVQAGIDIKGHVHLGSDMDLYPKLLVISNCNLFHPLVSQSIYDASSSYNMCFQHVLALQPNMYETVLNHKRYEVLTLCRI